MYKIRLEAGKQWNNVLTQYAKEIGHANTCSHFVSASIGDRECLKLRVPAPRLTAIKAASAAVGTPSECHEGNKCQR